MTNNSFNPVPGNGFSGFELDLPSFPPDLGNVTNPGPGWVNNCCSSAPEEWDIRDSVGTGILVGESGVFSFTSAPRTITNSTGWFHSWVGGGQTDITNYTATPGELGPEVPNVLKPPIPEPGSILLLGTGILGLAGVLRRKLML